VRSSIFGSQNSRTASSKFGGTSLAGQDGNMVATWKTATKHQQIKNTQRNVSEGQISCS